jgi:hypothetical protein
MRTEELLEAVLSLRSDPKLHKKRATQGSVVIYARHELKFAADTYLIKLKRLQNKVLRTIGNFTSCTPVSDLHMAFNIPYVYDYAKKKKIVKTTSRSHTKS